MTTHANGADYSTRATPGKSTLDTAAQALKARGERPQNETWLALTATATSNEIATNILITQDITDTYQVGQEATAARNARQIIDDLAAAVREDKVAGISPDAKISVTVGILAPGVDMDDEEDLDFLLRDVLIALESGYKLLDGYTLGSSGVYIFQSQESLPLSEIPQDAEIYTI